MASKRRATGYVDRGFCQLSSGQALRLIGGLQIEQQIPNIEFWTISIASLLDENINRQQDRHGNSRTITLVHTLPLIHSKGGSKANLVIFVNKNNLIQITPLQSFFV